MLPFFWPASFCLLEISRYRTFFDYFSWVKNFQAIRVNWNWQNSFWILVMRWALSLTLHIKMWGFFYWFLATYLESSWFGAMIWICDTNSVDNIQVFLLSDVCMVLSTFPAPHPSWALLFWGWWTPAHPCHMGNEFLGFFLLVHTTFVLCIKFSSSQPTHFYTLTLPIIFLIPQEEIVGSAGQGLSCL